MENLSQLVSGTVCLEEKWCLVWVKKISYKFDVTYWLRIFHATSICDFQKIDTESPMAVSPCGCNLFNFLIRKSSCLFTLSISYREVFSEYQFLKFKCVDSSIKIFYIWWIRGSKFVSLENNFLFLNCALFHPVFA